LKSRQERTEQEEQARAKDTEAEAEAEAMLWRGFFKCEMGLKTEISAKLYLIIFRREASGEEPQS